jgi:hypothetical protein
MPKKVRAPILLSGPYNPPPCKVGDTLHCELFGDVKVAGFSKALQPWPMCKPTSSGSAGRPYHGRRPILCGDLVRAIVEESHRAVSYYWDAPMSLVAKWRETVAGSTEAVEFALALKRADLEFRKKYYPPDQLRPPIPGV